jgi:hypothetical protein
LADFTLKRHDQLPPLIAELRVNQGSYENIFAIPQGSVVRFLAKSQTSGQAIINTTNVQVVDAQRGVIQYNWQPQDTEVHGIYDIEFQLTMPGSQRITFPNCGFKTLEIVHNIDDCVVNNSPMVQSSVVVASFNATNQSGSLSFTLLQNPSPGLYQINVYYACTIADGTATLVGHVTYADESGSTSQMIFGPEDGPGFVKGFNDFDIPFFQAQSGTPIGLEITVAAQTTFQYAIHVVLLQFPPV